MSPAELFCAVGETLHGQMWKTELARTIGYDEKQVRRWASGQYRPPARVWASLAAIISARCVDLSALKKPVSELARAGK